VTVSTLSPYPIAWSNYGGHPSAPCCCPHSFTGCEDVVSLELLHQVRLASLELLHQAARFSGVITYYTRQLVSLELLHQVRLASLELLHQVRLASLELLHQTPGAARFSRL
jgi:hypothetical protein